MTSPTIDFLQKRKYRRLEKGEQRLYDKDCPKCGTNEMIFMWSDELKKYTTSRCGSLKCDYGN